MYGTGFRVRKRIKHREAEDTEKKKRISNNKVKRKVKRVNARGANKIRKKSQKGSGAEDIGYTVRGIGGG